jgi:hypothetical protein
MDEPVADPRTTTDPTLAYEPPAHTSPAPVWGPAAPAPQPAASVPPAPWPPAAPPAAHSGPLTTTDLNWATAAHLSGFVAAYVALGFMGPLVVLLTEGRRSPFVRRHAVEALNFNLTVLIALAVSAVLVVVLVGFLMLPLVGIAYVVLTIMGAVAASRGQEFRYPLTIRFVR